MKTYAKAWSQVGGLVLVTVIAALLRLPGLGNSPIDAERSFLITVAMNVVKRCAVPLAANQTALGITAPPLIEYLIALPLLFKTTILAAVRFEALLGVAAVPILYLTLGRLFNERVALLASLLLATNPWAVYYSRLIGTAHPLPLFATLLLVTLLAYFAGSGRPIHLTLAMLWLAAVTQLEPAALILAPLLILFLFLFRHRPKRPGSVRALCAGLILALLLYWPYLRYQQATGYGDFRALVDTWLGRSAGAPLETNWASFLLILELAGGSHLFSAGPVWGEAILPWHSLATFAQFLFMVSLVYAIIRPLAWYVRRQKRPEGNALPPREVALVILVLWILVPGFFYLRHAFYLQNSHFLYILPAAFILVALMLDSLWDMVGASVGQPDAGRRGARLVMQGVTWLPLLLLCLWQFHTYWVGLALPAGGQVVGGQRAADLDAIINTSREVLLAHPECDGVVLGPGTSAEASPLGLLAAFAPKSLRYVEAGRGFLVPDRCALYLVTASDDAADRWLGQQAVLLPEVVETAGMTLHFYRAEEVATAGAEPLAIWRNHLRLLDYSLEGEASAGQTLRVTYTWQVVQKPLPGTEYHFFNHLLDTAGNIVAQEDGPGVQTAYWQPGDQLVTHFYLNLPPELAAGEYTMLTGLYRWPELERTRLRDEETTTYQVAVLAVP